MTPIKGKALNGAIRQVAFPFYTGPAGFADHGRTFSYRGMPARNFTPVEGTIDGDTAQAVSMDRSALNSGFVVVGLAEPIPVL